MTQDADGAEGFLKKLFGFSIHSYIGFAITLLSMLVTTRCFSTSELGKLNLYMTVLNIVVYIGYMGVDQSYCRYYNELETEKEKAILLNQCLTISFYALTIISVLVIILWKPIALYIYGEQEFLIPACLMLSSFTQIVCRYISLKYRMKHEILLYTAILTLLSVANKLSYILIKLWNGDAKDAIIVICFSGMIILLIVFMKEKQETRISFSKIKSNQESNTRLIKFGVPLMPISLLSWANSSIPTFMINSLIGYSAVGIYSSAVTISTTISLVQSGFNTFWVPYVYENYKNSHDKIVKVHNLMTFLLTAFGLMLMLAQDVIYIIVGSSYKSGKSIFGLLLLSPIFYTIAETTGIGINLSKKSYLNLYHYGSATIINLVMCYFLLRKTGLFGAAISVAVSSAVSLMIKTIIGERYYKCVGSYPKLLISIAVLMLAGVINYIFIDSFAIRCTATLSLFVAIIIVNRKEVRYLILTAVRLLVNRNKAGGKT